jgi:acyl-CoA thioesterase FadM
VTVNVNLNYRRECRQGDRLTIVTRPLKLGRTSFTMAQEIRKADGAVAADATIVLVTIDPTDRKPRVVPPELARAVEAAG